MCPSSPLASSTAPTIGTAPVIRLHQFVHRAMSGGLPQLGTDTAGDPIATTTADGAPTLYAYGDTAYPSLATTVTDPQGDVTTYSYDSAGRQTEAVVANHADTYTQTSITAYDSAGRVYCTIAPQAYGAGDTTCPSTPPTSAPTPDSDPNPGDSITIYDADNRPIYQVNPLGGAT